MEFQIILSQRQDLDQLARPADFLIQVEQQEHLISVLLQVTRCSISLDKGLFKIQPFWNNSWRKLLKLNPNFINKFKLILKHFLPCYLVVEQKEEKGQILLEQFESLKKKRKRSTD